MDKCYNCDQPKLPKLRYEKMPNSNAYEINEYTLEYCDHCFVQVFSQKVFQQLTSGKSHTKILVTTSLQSIAASLLLCSFLFAFFVINGMHFSGWMYGSIISVLLGLYLLFFQIFYQKKTHYKAITEVNNNLQEINNRNNNIVDEVIKKREDLLKKKKEEQYQEEMRRNENERREREKQVRKERERKERERKEHEWNQKVQERLCGIEEIDNMDGFQFEQRLKYLFQDLGYQVEITPKSGDQGVDLVLRKDNKVIAVQAKRYGNTNKVGNSAIQEVHTGKTFYDCSEAWVVTTSYFTESSKALAKKVCVRLINRNDLIGLLISQQELHGRILVCQNCGAKNNVDYQHIQRAICGNCKHSLKSSVFYEGH
ncbi:restriction endonuclease [Brevibacillus centrosporus]|uniref:restriction endonuclease n=1 Tax=Brevibacillus centrosporus TaxID=54910 RepID=UPI000F09AEA8|nr:restriction endonuclease [Brevibacillus centrosporus]MEC2132251.1 restriction endonuclease [Brevibacillus centrosporus]RNB72408.1 restriction endonuclease [Brevibacillus centrosporus]GED33827.1 hypothetical protein BCE02nite_49680 [Brevibacillus centrosporus]